MQSCAFDDQGQLTRASLAVRQCDYTCFECGQVVRLRKGTFRRPHFFHLQPNQACRQSGKGAVHLSVQHAILEQLPPGQAEMEHRFDAIGRIADVAWIPQKIVFEVQCAFITAAEVLARNQDYASVGFSVVWILHTDRYNKMQMTSAEEVLHNRAHYFTDIDEEGKGTIFDQYAQVHLGRRSFPFPSSTIAIAKPFPIRQKKIPLSFQKRYSAWTHGFQGDYVDALHHGDQRLHDWLVKLEDPQPTYVGRLLCAWNTWVVRPYQIVLRHILEKCCR